MLRPNLDAGTAGLHDDDLFLRSREQARRLHERRLGELDLDNLVDEIGGIGSTQRRRLRSEREALIALPPPRRSPTCMIRPEACR